MWPSQLAVTMTWPQACVAAFWQDAFRNLYWDLRNVDAVAELDAKCSSGHVADPLGADSARNALLRVKLPDGNRNMLSSSRQSSVWQRDVLLSCMSQRSPETSCRKEGMLQASEIEFLDCEAFHGMAMETSLLKKRSYDHTVFTRLVTGASWFA